MGERSIRDGNLLSQTCVIAAQPILRELYGTPKGFNTHPDLIYEIYSLRLLLVNFFTKLSRY